MTPTSSSRLALRATRRKASRLGRLAPARLRDVHRTIVRRGPSPCGRCRWRCSPLPARWPVRDAANTASRCAAPSAMPRTIPGSARHSALPATTTRPRLCGTRTLEPCGAGRSRTCRASSQPWRGLSVAALRAQVRVAYAKVAEFQARGAVHVHAVIRLDGPDGPDTAPAGGATAQRLAEAVARTAARVAVTVAGPDGRELIVRWGEQIDVRARSRRNANAGERTRSRQSQATSQSTQPRTQALAAAWIDGSASRE